MKIIQRMLVLLIAMTMLVSGSLVQVFANEEIEDNSAAVAVSEETADFVVETEAEEEIEKTEEAETAEEVEKTEEEVIEETAAEESEMTNTDEPGAQEAPEEEIAADNNEDQAEEAEAEDEEEDEEEDEDEIFTAGTLTYECDEYTVTLEYGEKSEIPEGTELVVHEISSDSDDAKEQEEYEEYYNRSLEQLRSENGGDAIAKLGFARFYDITLVSGDEEIEPGDDVKVTFTFSKDSRESVKEGNNEDDAIRVIHLTESVETGEINAEPIEKKDTDLTLEDKELKKAEFTAESFSVYGIVYTVDFEYEGYTYNIAGESEIMLSELFSMLNIEESAMDAENVEFTDYSLIKIEKEDDDWKLTSLKPFDTEEKLTVTLTEKIIEIKVTDDASVARVSNDGGNTWTYHADLIHSGTQQGGSTVMRGAFDQANTLSGDVIVEILMDSDDSYTLKNGFTFDNTAITSLTIRGTDNKSTLVKDQASAPMITTTGIDNVEFSSIIFEGEDKKTPNGNGGAVNTDADKLKVSNCIFNKCQAGYQGGGIYHNNTSGTATIKDSTFTGCRANGPDDNKGGGGGGAFSNAQSLTVTGCTFDSCTTSVRQGAGFFHKRTKTDEGGSVTVVKGCIFENCTSKWCGAGMESDAWDITIEDSSFTNCKASKGGAINVWADGQDATSNHTTFNVTNCTFESCTGTDNGGAIRSTSYTNLTDSTFIECSSAANGGAIACTNSNTETTITDCNFSDCHADNGNGGACFTNGKIITISETAAGKTLINGCSAKIGGAIRSGILTMSGGTISGCSATEKGGAIYSTSKITMTGGTVTGCTTSGESAALDAATGVSGFTFSGDVVVNGNIGSNEEARDVYIGTDTDRHILIDKSGLGDNASIGVYVADVNWAYEKHGKQNQMFAHTGNVKAANISNLDKLFNDRHENLYGAPAVSGENSDKRIMWAGGETEIAPTNVDLRMMPYILILIGGAALVLIKKVSDRRRKNEDDTDETEE